MLNLSTQGGREFNSKFAEREMMVIRGMRKREKRLLILRDTLAAPKLSQSVNPARLRVHLKLEDKITCVIGGLCTTSL